MQEPLSGVPPTAPTAQTRRGSQIAGLLLFLVLAVIGLYIAKWNPYFFKAFKAAAAHSLGSSIVSGKAATAPAPSLSAAISYGITYFKSIWEALVVGLVLAATIETAVPRNWIERILGRPSVRSSFLGALFAIPGMMCTCCSAPMIVSMRKSGVSAGGATAFWLGNPTLNPAVLVFLVFTLGWQWAALRLVLGLAVVIAGAWVATRLTRGTDASTVALPESVVEEPSYPAPNQPGIVRWLRAFGRLTISLVPEYLVIVLLLGAFRAFLFPASGILGGAGLLVVLGLALAGTLFVIPTAGEIPIIQTLLFFGMGAGGAGALLLTLAPLSLPSAAMVARVFPVRVLLALGGVVALAGIVAGALAMALHL